MNHYFNKVYIIYVLLSEKNGIARFFCFQKVFLTSDIEYIYIMLQIIYIRILGFGNNGIAIWKNLVGIGEVLILMGVAG